MNNTKERNDNMPGTISKCRLNAYQLFFEKPLCRYTDSRTQKVLIIGNGEQAKEAFKISLIAGQMMDKSLLVDYFSDDAKQFGENMLSESGDFPALNKFINNKDSAVNFKSENYSLINYEEYDYIIISDDDKKTNINIANIANATLFQKNTLIAIYGVSSKDISINNENIEVFTWGNQSIEDLRKSELMRLAKNINFAYAMKYNQNTSCKTADEDFMKSFDKEFNASASNFHGADYKADSSIACAMHIPYKLELCKTLGDFNNAERILSKSIVHRDHIYKNLVELEHKRWNVFMALRGFRAPTEEEYKYLHIENNDHKNKAKLIHMCMVEFEKLNKAYKVSRKIATQNSKKIIENKESILSKLDDTNYNEHNLKLAIEKLFNQDTNSVKLYENCMSVAKKSIDEERKVILDKIETDLSVVVTRNKNVDFKGIDEQLIDFLPFCLWYRKKFKKVITISDKNALKDVIIPTIFCSCKSLFLGNAIERDYDYAEKVTEYFKSRFGDYKNIKFEDCDEENFDELLEKEIDEEGRESILINVSGQQNTALAVALGKLIAKYPEVTIVSYDKKVTVINGDQNISAGINNKYFTAEEIIRLTGGEPINEYNKILSIDQRQTIGNFFNKYYTFDSYKVINSKGEEKTNYFNTWISMTDVFKQILKNDNLEISRKYEKSNCFDFAIGKLVFEKDIYESSGLKDTLDGCFKKRIIKDLEIKEKDEEVYVSFKYVASEQELFNTFKVFEKPECLTPLDSEDAIKEMIRKYKRINLNRDSIGTYSLYINKPLNKNNNVIRLYEDSDNKKIKESREAFMRELEECGFIKNLTPENLQDFNFIIKNKYIRWLLMTQGAIWEQIVLHQLLLHGQFDDLKLGVNFSWNKYLRNFDGDVQRKIDCMKTTGEFGYQAFQMCVNSVKKENENINMLAGIENEIDVIAVKKMNSYFISCKTNKKHENNWLYEIGSLSNHFDAMPIMATSHIYGEAKCDFAVRAFQMGISLLGMETIWNNNKLEIAIGSILEGKIVNPKINKKEEYEYVL